MRDVVRSCAEEDAIGRIKTTLLWKNRKGEDINDQDVAAKFVKYELVLGYICSCDEAECVGLVVDF